MMKFLFKKPGNPRGFVAYHKKWTGPNLLLGNMEYVILTGEVLGKK